MSKIGLNTKFVVPRLSDVFIVLQICVQYEMYSTLSILTERFLIFDKVKGI